MSLYSNCFFPVPLLKMLLHGQITGLFNKVMPNLPCNVYTDVC